MSTAATPVYEWKNLPWREIERAVFKLQERIYQASRRGDTRAVHRLQRLLMKSWSAKCLAVRRVSQDNRGKNTAGVDGVRSLTSPQRLELARELSLDQQAQPTRRVWIPKPGKAEKRPLGIPTMANRAAQALAKLALEPQWEGKFEPNSYGFRPGRSCHDAVVALFKSIHRMDKYVLDADIAKCFDRIDHQALLNKLATFPILRRAIKGWLKAGVMDGSELFPTEEGTPQGGVISPLLANVALHGLEEAIVIAFPRHQTPEGLVQRAKVVRYADDFVVLHRELAVIEEVKQVASQWLAGMGLEMKPSKTRITHTLHPHEGAVGFDFLGFNVRQYPVGKTHRRKSGGRGGSSVWLDYVTLIKPSQEAMHRHSKALQAVVRQHKAAPQRALIVRINSIIRGWANYYSAMVSKGSFSKLDHLLYIKLRHWARSRHHNKPWSWIAKKYWRLETGKWDFATREGLRMYNHSQTPIRRHVKVQGDRSPYDGDWVYWASRMGSHPELPKGVAILLRRQRGRCAHCGLYFKDGDWPEVYRSIRPAEGGKNGLTHSELLHHHCHDEKAAAAKAAARGTRDRSRAVEEPDEAKVSRPVLKTGRRGDSPA
jgi:RNA-directed DNA polymerase